jgi:hypothetical protein
MNAACRIFLAGIGNEKFGVSDDVRSQAAEAAALFMVGLIVLVIGLVVAFAILMARRSRKPDDTLKFLDELEEPPSAPTPPASNAPAKPWEKPADWWSQ